MKSGILVVVLAGLAASVGCAATTSPSEEIASTDNAIIGGVTELGHPYVVGIGSNSRAFCTGTVISKRTVLTAGHCYADGITKVYFGNNINSGGGARTVAVAQAVRHPGYATVNLGSITAPTNDLTIVKLAEDAPVAPAPLFRENLDNSDAFIGPDFVFVGYGDNHTGGFGGGFGTKRSTHYAIKAVGPAQVGGTPGKIDATMFYYNVAGLSMCHGDSGGPAFYVKDGVEHLAGVTSFGNPRCASDGVQQRSDAPAIATFIQAQIDAFEPDNACKSDGTCNESCNTNGTVQDPDCAEAHCGADGVCSSACVADPDCSSTSADAGTDH